MIKIDKGIAIPEQPRGRRPKYPWAEMSVGDSFLVPGIKGADMSSRVSSYRKYSPEKKFLCRTVEGGTRVWRVE